MVSNFTTWEYISILWILPSLIVMLLFLFRLRLDGTLPENMDRYDKAGVFFFSLIWPIGVVMLFLSLSLDKFIVTLFKER